MRLVGSARAAHADNGGVQSHEAGPAAFSPVPPLTASVAPTPNATSSPASAMLKRARHVPRTPAARTWRYLFFGIGLPCPLLSLTGIQCPLCGSTRAAGALAEGDVAAAWGYNALLVLVLPILIVCAVAWTVELAGGPALRPPKPWRPLTQTKIYWIAGVVGAVFMIVRNLV